MRNSTDDRPKILFVDDSKTVRGVAKKILSAKYIVHEAVNGKDAWEQLESYPEFAVVFVDLQMPEMNGLELQQRMIGMGWKIPVIIVSGLPGRHLAVKEPAAVFDKPIEPEAFINAVEKALGD